jgi:hypothetical protein
VRLGADKQSDKRLPIAVAGILTLFGVIAYGPHLELFAISMLRPHLISFAVDRDFANYWVAARMVLEGSHEILFDQQRYFSHLQQMFGSGYSPHNWGYPPHFLLLIWPLGFFSYKAALVGFLVTTFAFFVLAVVFFRRKYAPESGISILVLAMLGYALVMVDAAQNGFLLSAFCLLGFAWMKERPVLAGVAFALLTVKPQLGILIPLLLALDRNWKAISWTVVFTSMLVAASAVLYGVQTWSAYLSDGISYQTGAVMTQWGGIFLRMMPTAFAGMRSLGFSAEASHLAQIPFSLLGVSMVVWALCCDADPLRRIFAAVCGAFVVSPYAFNYDMGALVVIAAMIVASKRVSGQSRLLALAIIAGLCPAVMNLGRANLPIAPLLLMAALVALVQQARHERTQGISPK